MSHVDEGELTAYADAAYASEDPDAQRIAAHLAECANCRNRLAQAQALSLRASQVLAVAAPLTVLTPPFDDIARVTSARRRRFPAIPLTWAATVILALGIGWFGRASVTPVTRTLPPTAEVATPAVSAAPPAMATTEEGQSARQQLPQTETRMRAREFDTPTATQLSVEVANDRVAASPAPAAPVAVAPPEASVPTIRAQGVGAAAGNAFPMIPELEVVSIKSVGDSVHVQQKLPDGVVITVMSRVPQVTEGAAGARRAESAMMDAARKQLLASSTAPFRVYGPLTEDSLRALLGKVR